MTALSTLRKTDGKGAKVQIECLVRTLAVVQAREDAGLDQGGSGDEVKWVDWKDG